MLFAVGINEFVLNMRLYNPVPILAVAVIGVSVVLGIKPRVASLWAVGAIGGADEFTGQRGDSSR